ncbi:MAG: nucleotidyltransferase domain-containing protein [Anaerolineaceae bacterium]|nr:nucleotidyltransferase domain-containing protein [Anaerolineaceae bacterium]
MDIHQIRAFTPQIQAIAKKHGITSVYLFGSVAKLTTTQSSDVDFLVKMDDGASLFGMAGFLYECEKLLGVPVDVIPYSLLNDIDDRDFATNIQKDAVML